MVRPKIIVCLGRIAAKALINPDFKITKERGIWIERKGIYMTATFHPSAVLRDMLKKETGVGGHEKHKTKTYGSKRREKY